SHHKVEALFDSNAADAEDLCHIDDANPAYFHVIACQFRRGGHELASFQHRNAGHVVGYKTVTTLDQPQHALAFPDTAYSADQNADAQDVYHAAEFGYRRRKIHFQSDRGSVDELHRDHRRTEHGDFCLASDTQQLRREMKPARHHQAGNPVFAQFAKSLDAQFRG